jgi:hypothetical protein
MKGLEYNPGEPHATLTGQQIEFIQDNGAQLFRALEQIRALALRPGMTPKKRADEMDRIASEAVRRIDQGMRNHKEPPREEQYDAPAA